MRISALSNINFRQTDAVENKVENKKPEDTKKQGLSTTAKTLIGAGLVAAGTLAVYFITRNSKAAKNTAEAATNAASEASKTENIKNPLEAGEKKIETVLKDFKSDIQDIKETIVEKLETGFTRITYSGKNAEGHDIKDMVFFNKNNDVVQRMIEQTTPKEQIRIVYKGDNTILASPDEMPEGRYNPKYFQRQIAVSNMEKLGNDNVQDSAFYNQTASMFDNQGRFKDITRRYKTNDKKTKISTHISTGTVELKQNAETKIHEFDWNTKKELNTKQIGFAYTDNNKLNAYFTRFTKINGETPAQDKVYLKYRDKKYGIVYDTHAEMHAHEPNLYKKAPDTSDKANPDTVQPPQIKAPKTTKEFIQGYEMSSKEAQEALKNLNPKIKNYLDTSLFSEFDDLTHRNIVSLKNGKTQVEYSGISDFGDKYKEVILFDKNNEFAGKRSISIISDTETIETIKTVSTQTSDKKTRIAALISDAKTNQKKKFTVNEDNNTIKEIIFGYDKDAKPSGYAYTENNQVILKLKDKKFGQVFENFEDIQANVNKDEFKTL